MGLFQKSVLKKYIGDTDAAALQAAWQRFQLHFKNIDKQHNIRNAKEEQYQEGFLRELFVDVLGYTLNPQPNFNLTTEYKNEKDSKKADGAIINGQQVLAVIELKGADTTDLKKVEAQAFGYKNNQKGCTYIITSNFEKLRFYINDATDFEAFNLFTITQSEFALLYLCLQKDNLLAHLPLQMKEASVAAEENVTKALYADYSKFKKQLYHNIVALNPQHNKLLLFKKTQKLLDRFLFIFFAEDRLLLPPNSVRNILSQWQQLQELDNYVPLYDRFKKYFGYLNTGHKGKVHEIFAYNGGLFATDDILDAITIDDDTLYQSCVTLSNYDFDTEVDVNILGHIFEHSLNEIEELQAELDGVVIDKTKTKRKKDGVFYTPRYITKYIVDSTVGALCEQQKTALKIVEDEFTTEKRKANKKKLLLQLEAYRQWLLQLTICDPACGSGAFLNQALDFLLAEHRYIDELQAKLFGDSIVYSDVEKQILENNLFGVDINEEAVEIARLSLWLRTAHKGRKLNNLSNNIKCGNSLIDDATVAGDKAFNWHKEFPQVFGSYTEPLQLEDEPISQEQPVVNVEVDTNEDEYKIVPPTERITNRDDAVVNTDFNIVNEPSETYGGTQKERRGFDVIIGNPPYVRPRTITDKQLYFLMTNYVSSENQIDLYQLFIEKGNSIIKNNGMIAFIVPNAFLANENSRKLRKYILENYAIEQIVECKMNVFADADVESLMFVFSKNANLFVGKYFELVNEDVVYKHDFLSKNFSLNKNQNFTVTLSEVGFKLFNKIKNKSLPLSDYFDVVTGIKEYQVGKGNPAQTQFDKDNLVFNSNKKDNDTFQPELRGKNIQRYGLDWQNEYVSYGEWIAEPRNPIFFEGEKILVRQIPSKQSLIVSYTSDFYIVDQSVFIAKPKTDSVLNVKFILACLNSRLMFWFFRNENNEFDELFPKIKAKELKALPIVLIDKNTQLPFIDKANTMLVKTKALQVLQNNFLKLLVSRYPQIKPNNKLNTWYLLSFGAFVKELEKQGIKLSLKEQADWMDYFADEQAKAIAIKDDISNTDKAIDAMVYALYGLTDEEIKIVEAN
jgi:type I restriction-modification system DNA methylase subunit